jgi:CDP-diacylglycerol--serine O-phosphatidyltransferase
MIEPAHRPPPHKGAYIFPNLLTAGNLFAGFYAIVTAMNLHFERAAVAIIIAAFMDGLDGKIARMTGTSSRFGVEFDSLADLVSFGVAPALLVYIWELKAFPRIGWVAAFLFVACGALRLARFNVLAARGDKASHRFFTGLPIPLAAGALVSVVIAHYRHYGAPTDPSTHAPIAVGVALLSFLMVSTVRYRTFKETRLTPRSFATFGFVLAAGVVIGIATRASFVLLVYAGAYILMGLVESIFFRHTIEKSSLPASVQREIESDEALEPDDDDLETKDEGDEYI